MSTPGLDSLQTMIHGDSKMDNFMFRQMPKKPGEEEEEYEAVLIDWQGVCFDLVILQSVSNLLLYLVQHGYQ